MKFRRIVPALSLLSISSIVTPLCLTSCSQDTFYTFDLTDESNLPEVEGIATEGALDGPGATNTYLEVVKKDPRILMNDYVRGQYASVCNTFGGPDFKIKEFTISTTTPKIGESIVHYPASVVQSENPDIPYPTASFKVKYHLVVNVKSIISETKRADATLNIDFTAQYKDVLFTVYSKSDTIAARNDLQIEGLWNVGYLDPFDIGIHSGRAAPYVFKFASDPWSIKVNYNYSYDCTTTDTVTGRTIKTNDSYTFSSILDTFSKLDSVLLTISDAEAKLHDPQLSKDDRLDAIGQYCLISGVAFDYRSSAMATAKSDVVPYFDALQTSVNYYGAYGEDTLFKLYGFQSVAFSEEFGSIESYSIVIPSGLTQWNIDWVVDVNYDDPVQGEGTWNNDGLNFNVQFPFTSGELDWDDETSTFCMTITNQLYAELSNLYITWDSFVTTQGLQVSPQDCFIEWLNRKLAGLNNSFVFPDATVTITTSDGVEHTAELKITSTPNVSLPIPEVVQRWISDMPQP